MSILLSILFICITVFLFSLAVFIHEFGHFIVARLLGLRADVFSIGFGPALWKKTIGGTEYRISSVPFGGYVSLPQLDPKGMERIQGAVAETLPPATPWKRILVAVAGPLGNVVLAVICAAIIAMWAPESVFSSTTRVGLIEENSPAAQHGLKRGDKILAVNGNPVNTWQDFQTECYLGGSSNAVVQLTIERGASETLTIATPLDKQIADDIYGIGGILPDSCHLGVVRVEENSPAAQAGLKPGDLLIEVNGKPFTDFDELPKPSVDTPTITNVFTVKNVEDGSLRTVSVTPACYKHTENETPRMGVVIAPVGPQTYQWMSERGVWAQLRADASSIIRVLKALTAPKSKGETARAAKGLGGPLMIVTLLYKIVQTGLWVSLGFIRLICINLAILNLLPLPVLDGGHILFACYAIIRRKEAPAKVIEFATTVFACLLLGLMVLFVFRDALRLLVK